MARERDWGHRQWESAAMCVSHLSFCFSSVLECRSAITLVFLVVPIEAELVLQYSFTVFHGASELRKRWFLAIRQADWSNFRVPNSTIVCTANLLLEKKFRFHARALEPVDSSITSSLKPRMAGHFPIAYAVPYFFFSPAFLPSESTKHVDALRESVMFCPPLSGPNDEATQYQKLAESKGKRLHCRRSLCQEAFVFQVALGRAPEVYTHCVCEVTIERYLEFKKLGFLEWHLTVPFFFLLKYSFRRAGCSNLSFKNPNPNPKNRTSKALFNVGGDDVWTLTIQEIWLSCGSTVAYFFYWSSLKDEQCSNLSLDDLNPMNHTQISPKRREGKQLFARRKHWNRMQATDRPRTDAPSLTQTIIVQMVYMKNFKSQNLRKKHNTYNIVRLFRPLKKLPGTMRIWLCSRSLWKKKGKKGKRITIIGLKSVIPKHSASAV